MSAPSDQTSASTSQKSVPSEQMSASIDQTSAPPGQRTALIEQMSVSMEQMSAPIEQMSASIVHFPARLEQIPRLFALHSFGNGHNWETSMTTSADTIVHTLRTLYGELINGAPLSGSYMLNIGDAGLLASLDKISPADASRSSAGGATIAAHADHLRYGLSMMNRWGGGEKKPWEGADWTTSWRIARVTEEEWNDLCAALRKEATKWLEIAGEPKEFSPFELNVVMGNIAHVAYHLGAIRQIARATRGPTAEEEKQLQSQK